MFTPKEEGAGPGLEDPRRRTLSQRYGATLLLVAFCLLLAFLIMYEELSR